MASEPTVHNGRRHEPEICDKWNGGHESCPTCDRYWEDVAAEYDEED
jgi:hypothetical protein